MPEAGQLYERAATSTPEASERLVMRIKAALSLFPTDAPQADTTLAKLQEEVDGHSEAALLRACRAAVESDPEAILEHGPQAIGVTETSDVLVRSFMGQAHLMRGDVDLAIAELDEIATPERGGLRLVLATALITRAGNEDAGRRTDDGARARDIALAVRDERRGWGGDSAAAALIAGQAAAALGDWDAVLMIGSATHGEATTDEARAVGLAELVGVAAALSDRLSDDDGEAENGMSPSGRAWLTGMRLARDPSTRPQATLAFQRAAEAAVGPVELERSLRGLAVQGVHPLPRLDDLAADEPERAATLDALAQYRSDSSLSALGELRRLARVTRIAAAFTATIEAERGDTELAANIALDAAARFDDPALVEQAVGILSSNDPEAAKRVASEHVDKIPAAAPERESLRRFLLDQAILSGDPEQVEQAALSALRDGAKDRRIEWLAVEAMHARGGAGRAWEQVESRSLTPDSDREAQLYLMLLDANAPDRWTDALEVLDRFSSSHDVLAAGLLLFFGHEHEAVDEEVGQRFGAHLQRFTELFPDSQAIQAMTFDLDDPDSMIATLRDALPEYSADTVAAVSKLGEELALGRAPCGACAVILGRNPLTLMCSGELASVPHLAGPESFATDVDAGRAALDSEVVLDITTLAAASLAPSLLEHLRSLCSRMVMPASQIADIVGFARSRPASGYLSSTEDGIHLVDVAETNQAAIGSRSEWMRVESSTIAAEPPPVAEPLSPLGDLEFEGSWAHAVHLAKATNRLLIADDPALIALARSAGVRATSSLAVAAAGRATDRMTDDQFNDTILEQVRTGFVDLPLTAQHLAEALAACGWPISPALGYLTRPAFWRTPGAARAHREIIGQLSSEDREAVPSLVWASIVGANRTVAPGTATGFASALATQVILTGDVRPDEMANVVAAARAAWPADTPDPLPALARTLRTEVEGLASPADAGRYVINLFQDLSEPDHHIALKAILGQ
jgi:hypothetical protein